jgi:hypothetical protein
MALNAAVIMPPLQQIIIDKTLATFLANGSVYFFEDANRTIPKSVYELTGTGPGSYTYTSLGAQITLSGIGSFVDGSGANIAIYLWPYTGSPNDMPPSQIVQNYYITVYSSTNVFQFDIPNWPGVIQGATPQVIADTTDNIISNPQFVDVSFPVTATSVAPFMFTTSGTNTATEVAPDWVMITTGSGNFSVYQQVISDNTAPSNPPYALGITSGGYSTPLILRQRIFSPRILASIGGMGGYVSGTFIAQSTGGAVPLTMNYTPSITGVIQQICTGTTLTSGFISIANVTAVQITNPGSGPGYVDISIVIPVGAAIQISSIQLCGVSNLQEQVFFLEQSPERQVDHLFHYFQPQLNFKPIPSLLTGWDFPLNPGQFLTSTQTVTTTAAYVLDQLIMGTSSGTVSVTKANTGALQVTTGANNQAFYLMQYVSGLQAFKFSLNNLCVNLNSFCGVTGVTAYVSLFFNNGSGIIPTAAGLGNGIIFSINASGQFTVLTSGWSAIPQRPNYTNSASISQPPTSPNSMLSGWNGYAFNNTTTTPSFAIGVAYVVPVSGTVIFINSISCNAGDIPTIPAPLTADETLRACQYYYEKTYIPSQFAGAVSLLGAQSAFQNSETTTATNIRAFFYQDTFYYQFKAVKRVINSTVTIWSINGASGNVTAHLNGVDTGGGNITGGGDLLISTYWTSAGLSNSSIFFTPLTAALGLDTLFITPNTGQGFIGTTAWINYHVIIDARLGIV